MHAKNAWWRILVLAVWLLALSSASALADNYGAIAYDRASDSWGASYDHASQQAANESAMRECGKFTSHCEVVVKFWGNLCAAYATGPGTTDGWGSGASRPAAEQQAVSACRSRGGPCEAKVWACNSQPGPGGFYVGGGNPATIYHCRYSNGNRVPNCYDRP
jgi:hypothetical protein